MQLDEQRLRFRDAMASLSAAVNVVTTHFTRRRMRLVRTAPLASASATESAAMVASTCTSPVPGHTRQGVNS